MTKLSWIRGAAILMLLTSFQSIAGDDGLASQLSDELDISMSKARGGAGAIFEYMEDMLDQDDFDDLVENIPEIDTLMDEAPEVDRDSRYGRASNRLRDFDSSRGGLASLAGSFDELNMDPEMLSEFLSVIREYLDSEAGEWATDLLEDTFPNEF